MILLTILKIKLPSNMHSNLKTNTNFIIHNRAIFNFTCNLDDNWFWNSLQTCLVMFQATIRARRLMTSHALPCHSSSNSLTNCDTDSIGKNWGLLSRLDPSRWSGASRKSASSRDTAAEGSKGAGAKSTPQPVTVTLSFKVTYSGGGACEKGYQRELTKWLFYIFWWIIPYHTNNIIGNAISKVLM